LKARKCFGWLVALFHSLLFLLFVYLCGFFCFILFNFFCCQRLLGVLNRPNPLDDWDQLYNLNNQVGLRNDCRKLAKLLDNEKSVPELESFMTLYCKKRNVDYRKDSGWIVVLEKISKFDLPPEHLFNVFFAFTTKYIPKETKDGAQIYDLFRLILQYHDPQVSSHLDSLKCAPYSYANQWFSTVLASSVDDAACRVLWELYIEKGDPFLIFYMALVLIINSRDKLSAYYADRTPQCIREDFHYLIFGSNYDDEVGEMQVNKLLCLPVTVQELTRRERTASAVKICYFLFYPSLLSIFVLRVPFVLTPTMFIGLSLTKVVQVPNISYFVIDCRSNEAYNCGHIYGSFNLDCKLLVDAPGQFEIALAWLESYKHEQKFDEHICFFGYGADDQDQFMNMVIARFLRDGRSHVSFAQGGYHEEYFIAKVSLSSMEIQPSTIKLVDKMKDVVISRSTAVKGKVSELVTHAAPGNAPTNEVRHVVSADRYGKRYRDEPSVFSIEDDSSDEGSGKLINKSGKKEELRLEDQAEFIERFQCHELGENKVMIPAHIAITRTQLHVLRDVESKPGYVTTEARHALSSILRVTSKKKVPELLTFRFGYEINGVSRVTAVHK
uniref:TBC1 domain family member 23 (inferred by orthology to a human protein) n=1 Tax=Nippostrongylus brasiliensis TaxID=27835 RepID=A0A158QZR6_NIPBR